MPDELKCVVATSGAVPTDPRPHRVWIWVGSAVPVDCPNNFTFNSVWWAFEDDEVRSIRLLRAQNDVPILTPVPPAEEDPVLAIWLQYQEVKNVPNGADIPWYPYLNATDVNKAFVDEYDEWSQFALKDNECDVTQDESRPVRVPIKMSTETPPERIIYCKTARPTKKSVCGALLRIAGWEKKHVVVSTNDSMEYLAYELSIPDNDDRKFLWRMYESFSPIFKQRKYYENPAPST